MKEPEELMFRSVILIGRANMLREEIKDCVNNAKRFFAEAHPELNNEEKSIEYNKFFDYVMNKAYKSPAESWDNWQERMKRLVNEYMHL